MRFCSENLHARPEQVQLFTPTPSTWSTLMYWTGQNPFTEQKCFVERDVHGREKQKQVLTGQAGNKKSFRQSAVRSADKGKRRKK